MEKQPTPPRLVLVGGFLGAGKTTLLRQAGGMLARRGVRVGIVTNDQAGDLVDSSTLRGEGFGVEEVAGGCFCCRFADLLASAGRLIAERRPEVLLCEPVGSCTDLAATVLRPLQQLYGKRFGVAPYTVLADPLRLKDLLERGARGPLSEKVLYIYNKQLEEADVIGLNKADLLAPGEFDALRARLARLFPRAQVLGLSTLEGDGLEAWWETVSQPAPAGQRGIHVNYDVYAEGEAELGWLNAALRLKANAPQAWKPRALELLKAFKNAFAARGAEVAHLKISMTAPGHALVGNLTSTHGQPFLYVKGAAEASSAEALLLVNARVQIEPEKLQAAVSESFERCFADLERSVERMECFKPGRPVPEHRIAPAETCTVGAENPCGVIRDILKPKPRAKEPADWA